MVPDSFFYVEKFNDSYERIFSHEKRLNSDVEDFYEFFLHNFLQSSAAVKDAFKFTATHQQIKMLKTSLPYLLNLQGAKSVSSPLTTVARTHSATGYNIQSELYDHWLDSLIESLKAFDPLFSEDAEIGWRMVLAPGIDFMKYNYDRHVSHLRPNLLAENPDALRSPPPA